MKLISLKGIDTNSVRVGTAATLGKGATYASNLMYYGGLFLDITGELFGIPSINDEQNNQNRMFILYID